MDMKFGLDPKNQGGLQQTKDSRERGNTKVVAVEYGKCSEASEDKYKYSTE